MPHAHNIWMMFRWTQPASTECLQIRRAAAYRRISHGCLEEIVSMTRNLHAAKHQYQKQRNFFWLFSQKIKRYGIYKDSQVSLPIATLNMTQLWLMWTLPLETAGSELWILGRKHASLPVLSFWFDKLANRIQVTYLLDCIFPNSDLCIAVAYVNYPSKICWSCGIV